jgi:protein-arginine kinase
VLINFEDHIDIIMTPPNSDLRKCMSRFVKLNHTFEKIGFASDAYLGSLTASP